MCTYTRTTKKLTSKTEANHKEKESKLKKKKWPF